MWIVILDQAYYPGALPFFYLLRTPDGSLHRIMSFEPNKLVYLIASSKSGHRSTLMFPNAFNEVRSDSDVQSSVRFAGQHINAKHTTLSLVVPATAGTHASAALVLSRAGKSVLML